MATSAYPGAIDTFNVPTLPEGTPLSSAGTSTRNHTQLHDAIDAAVVAVQTYAAQRTHDHSGDATSTTKGSKLAQANTHQSPDTDASTTSLHHSLGTGATQAAAGNHAHDYNGGTIFNKPFFLAQSNNRPLNPAIGTMIYEQDTNRVRVWSQFPGNTLSTGLNWTDNFERVNGNDLGPDWELTYIDLGGGAGKLATPDGHNASWIDTGNGNYRVIGRNINSTAMHTQTTDQVLTWVTGPTVVEGILPFTAGAFNDFFTRMSDNKQSYVRLSFGNNAIYAYYATAGPSSELILGSISVTTAVPNIPFTVYAIGRSWAIYQFGSLLGTITDNKLVTILTDNNKGWGIGMQAGFRGWGQTTPGNIASINIADAVVYLSQPRWTLLPVASIPYCRLRQTARQQISHTGTIISWGTDNTGVIEDNFGYFNPANPTQVTVTEPGKYQFNAVVQWDSNLVPDVGTVVLCIDGVETSIRQQQVMAGGTGTDPGFSQSIQLNGQVRCNPGDTLSIKASYVTASGLFNFIFSFFDGPTKIQSRFDLFYVGV